MAFLHNPSVSCLMLRLRSVSCLSLAMANNKERPQNTFPTLSNPLIGTQHAEVREHGYGLSFRAEHHPPPNGHSFGQGQRIGMRGLARDSRVGRHV
ncbi:hypothetical protein CDAR_253141 [Caerostris darwini]|uniref:Secreted protein n=1 Tax=Caerostris darwini TaxID=1538125 RepID=A0AAV4RB78_9ARAC|nr:hypothetical protein CDAR_253141 [Caerostris darwini]